MSTANILLKVNSIEVIYNHVILVLKGVSFSVPEGGIVALLGGNGAGKTTTLRAVSNLLRGERGEVTKGTIELRDERIEALSPAQLVKRGVIQVMEGRHCFAHLSIEENLLAGAYTRSEGKAAIAETLDKVYTYFPRLKTRRTSQAAYTSGGEQQMCAIGRALMANPRMVPVSYTHLDVYKRQDLQGLWGVQLCTGGNVAVRGAGHGAVFGVDSGWLLYTSRCV